MTDYGVWETNSFKIEEKTSESHIIQIKINTGNPTSIGSCTMQFEIYSMRGICEFQIQVKEGMNLEEVHGENWRMVWFWEEGRGGIVGGRERERGQQGSFQPHYAILAMVVFERMTQGKT